MPTDQKSEHIAIDDYTFIWNEDSWGITQESLKNLRDELCFRIKNKICIIQIETSSYVCGFFIIDKTRKQVVFTGDGFRLDKGGEGGAGYRTAEVLLNHIFGISYFIEIDSSESIRATMSSSFGREVSDEGLVDLTKSVLKAELAKVFDDELEFVIVFDKNPEYIR